MKLITSIVLTVFALTSGVCAKAGYQPDSLKQNRNSLVALPYAFYTPETKIALGAGILYSFRSSAALPDARPSNVRVALVYTQLKQIILAFLPEIYIENESYYLNGYCGFYKYPDMFWGIGNDTQDDAEEDFEPIYFKSNLNIQKRILPGLYIGLRYQYEYIHLRKTDGQGVLQYGTILGSEGGSTAGLGFIINHDTRNHIYQPSSGFYNQIYAMYFGRAVGSDYSFESVSFDLRKYTALFGSHVLALQMYDSFIFGDPPFQMLNMFGSSYWMRGYYQGRYRDKNMITFQAEYRLPLFWRFGAVAFAGFGDVSNEASKFRISDFKYTIGLGLRFVFDRQERINARLDVGMGKEGNSGVYALVVEAF
jgi:hypothetical protein